MPEIQYDPHRNYQYEAFIVRLRGHWYIMRDIFLTDVLIGRQTATNWEGLELEAQVEATWMYEDLAQRLPPPGSHQPISDDLRKRAEWPDGIEQNIVSEEDQF